MKTPQITLDKDAQARQEARRQSALTQLRRRYDELDRQTGQTAAQRVEEARARLEKH